MATATRTRKTAASKPAPETDEAPEHVDDLEAIAPEPGHVVVNGIPCTVRRIKFNEFMALVRVITNGIGAGIADVDLDMTDEESVTRDLSALMLLAVPNATVEFAMFLRTIVEADDPRKQDTVANYLLENPDIEPMLDIFEMVATQEREDLVVIAGKLQAMWKRLANVYSRPKPRKK